MQSASGVPLELIIGRWHYKPTILSGQLHNMAAFQVKTETYNRSPILLLREKQNENLK